MFFAITNNLLAPNTRTTKLGISPQAITTITWNNSENPKDGSSSMGCLYTIPESSHEDKSGVVVKA